MNKKQTALSLVLNPNAPPDKAFWEALTLQELLMLYALTKDHPTKGVFIEPIFNSIKTLPFTFADCQQSLKDNSLSEESELEFLLLQKMSSQAKTLREWGVLSVCKNGPIRNTALDNLAAESPSFNEWLSLKDLFSSHNDLAGLAQTRMQKLAGESETRKNVCKTLFPETISTTTKNSLQGYGNMTPCLV